MTGSRVRVAGITGHVVAERDGRVRVMTWAGAAFWCRTEHCEPV